MIILNQTKDKGASSIARALNIAGYKSIEDAEENGAKMYASIVPGLTPDNYHYNCLFFTVEKKDRRIKERRKCNC